MHLLQSLRDGMVRLESQIAAQLGGYLRVYQVLSIWNKLFGFMLLHGCPNARSHSVQIIQGGNVYSFSAFDVKQRDKFFAAVEMKATDWLTVVVVQQNAAVGLHIAHDYSIYRNSFA